ncbi:MAG: SurA N-terminal domain-containing protein [Simkaniaceae bacterium]|nr:SurA N-terminal domain-containing protein [Simkaniaceae bacterium]
MQKAYSLIFLLTAVFSLGFADYETEQPSQGPSSQSGLMINNRPLAKINGKVISLYDVVKKMDLFLFEYYPHLNLSPVEKYQFYLIRWQPTLDDMIHDELILLDAQQKEIKISDGEVREKLEERFGPNIMSNLHKMNYDYEEARAMIRQELTIQQLIGIKVHSKVFQTTTPQVIKMAYEKYLQENPPKEEWKYQVLSIRGKDEEQCAGVAKRAYNLLKKEEQPIEKLPSMLEETGVTISLSDDYSGGPQKLSKMHFDVIKALSPHSYSLPVSQVSRSDNSTVMRIFYLKEIIENLPETFEQMHDKLKNDLLYETSDKEKAAYIQSLKKRFGYENYNPKCELSEDYQPFAMP